MKDKPKVPAPTPDVLQPKLETVSATPNSPVLLEAYSPLREDVKDDCFLADSNMPEAVDVGDTCHNQLKAAPGASPNRIRRSDPKLINENGSTHFAHTTNAPAPPSLDSHSKEREDAKVALFTRGGSGNSDELPRPGMSDRSFNSNNADAPNTKKA
jgi:hypothetical protein